MKVLKFILIALAMVAVGYWSTINDDDDGADAAMFARRATEMQQAAR